MSGALGILTEPNVPNPNARWRPHGSARVPPRRRRPVPRNPAAHAVRPPKVWIRAVRARWVRRSLPWTRAARYGSEGDWVPFTEEHTGDAEDGYDSVEWLAAQPWCDGNVGTLGASYNAWMQWQLAKLRPPHLVAMCAYTIPLELTEVDWPGGFRPGRRIKWWLTSMAPDLRRRHGLPPPHTPEQARQGVGQDCRRGPLDRLPAVARFHPPPTAGPGGVRKGLARAPESASLEIRRGTQGSSRTKPRLQRLVRPLQRLDATPTAHAAPRSHRAGAVANKTHRRSVESPEPRQPHSSRVRLRATSWSRPAGPNHPLVRPLAQGDRQRRRSRASSALLLNGRTTGSMALDRHLASSGHNTL